MEKYSNNVDNEEETYSTSDLGIASFLAVAGFHPVEIKYAEFPLRNVFIYKMSPELDMATEHYWDKVARVEPQEYYNAIKNLKTRIYAKPKH